MLCRICNVLCVDCLAIISTAVWVISAKTGTKTLTLLQMAWFGCRSCLRLSSLLQVPPLRSSTILEEDCMDTKSSSQGGAPGSNARTGKGPMHRRVRSAAALQLRYTILARLQSRLQVGKCIQTDAPYTYSMDFKFLIATFPSL